MTRPRFAPTELDAIERLDDYGLSLGNFIRAATLGHWVAPDGTCRKLERGESPIATLVTASRRARILKQANISPQTWRNLTTKWVENRLAHRCKRGDICLFTSPRDGMRATCPFCRDRLYRISGQVSPEERDDSYRIPGQGERETAALTSGNAEVPGGYQRGEGVGVPRDPASKRSEEEIEHAALELAKKTLGAEEVAS